MKQSRFVYSPETIDCVQRQRFEIFGHPWFDNDLIRFDGIGDGIIVRENCLSGALTFNISVQFRPRKGGGAEQRFLHIQGENCTDRVLLEIRLSADGVHWYADTFLKSGTTEVVLQDPNRLHPVDEWHVYAVSYDGDIFQHSISDVVECRASMRAARAPSNGVTSIGFRATREFHFCGDIRSIVLSIEGDSANMWHKEA